MPEKNVNSPSTLPTALHPTPDESGMTVPQLLQHRIDVLFEQVPLVAELGKVFAQAGHDLYLVGGSVRDALMGRLGHDLDFTTDARPDTTEAILRSCMGHRPSLRDYRRPDRRLGGGGHHLPRRRVPP